MKPETGENTIFLRAGVPAVVGDSPAWARWAVPGLVAGALLLLGGCAGWSAGQEAGLAADAAVLPVSRPGDFEGVVVWAVKVTTPESAAGSAGPEDRELFLQARQGNSLLTCLPQPDSTLALAGEEVVYRTARNADGYAPVAPLPASRADFSLELEPTNEQRRIHDFPCWKTVARVTRTQDGRPVRDVYEIWATDRITLNLTALHHSRIGAWEGFGYVLSQVDGVPLLVVQAPRDNRAGFVLEATSIMRGPIDLASFSVHSLRDL